MILAGVGSGLTAKAAAQGGADVLAVYNTAAYRIRGLPTALAFLPYDNANELTIQVAPEVMANAGHIPVLFGFGAHDPRTPPFRLLDRAQELGASGVTNEPFLGIYGSELRSQLEAAGLGFPREVALIRAAVDRDMLTLGWVFSATEATQMAEAGAQMIGVVLGVTAGGAAGGAPAKSLDDAIAEFVPVMTAAKSVNERIIVLGHGGPLNDPDSVGAFILATGADGYATGSTGERLPVEVGVADAIRRFKRLSLAGKSISGGLHV